tara:strand:+ start:271 stop:438 length:168 start_codon:yes stop_codon:yes gene_type:complete
LEEVLWFKELSSSIKYEFCVDRNFHQGDRVVVLVFSGAMGRSDRNDEIADVDFKP